MAKNWYAIYVSPRTEKKVDSLLQQSGIETYLPLDKKLRQWHDRKKWVDFPVISGYDFVKISQNERLKVLHTDHVIGMVRHMGQDAVIPECQIICMKKMLGQHEFPVELCVGELSFLQPVRVISGPLAGICGSLTKIKGKKKVVLELDILKVNMSVELPLYQIEIIGNKQMG